MTRASLDLSDPKHVHADERLRSDLMVWLGTVRPDGLPHVVPVWFLWDGETLLIFSESDQKIRNLRNNKQVMVTLDDTKGGEDVIMMRGEAELLEPGTLTPALPPYAEKYAQKLADLGWTAESMGGVFAMAIRITPMKFWIW